MLGASARCKSARGSWGGSRGCVQACPEEREDVTSTRVPLGDAPRRQTPARGTSSEGRSLGMLVRGTQARRGDASTIAQATSVVAGDVCAYAREETDAGGVTDRGTLTEGRRRGGRRGGAGDVRAGGASVPRACERTWDGDPGGGTSVRRTRRRRGRRPRRGPSGDVRTGGRMPARGHARVGVVLVAQVRVGTEAGTGGAD